MVFRSTLIVLLLGVIAILAGVVGWQRHVMSRSTLRHVETRLLLEEAQERIRLLMAAQAEPGRHSRADERAQRIELLEAQIAERERENAALVTRLAATSRDLEASLGEKSRLAQSLVAAEERMAELRAEKESPEKQSLGALRLSKTPGPLEESDGVQRALDASLAAPVGTRMIRRKERLQDATAAEASNAPAFNSLP